VTVWRHAVELLFLAKRTKSSRENYRRFATAAEAIRYAVEDLRTAQAHGAWMQVGDERFNSDDIQRLYDDGVFLCANFGRLSVCGRSDGSPSRAETEGFKEAPDFSKKPSKASGAGYDANGRCEALKIFGPIGPERKVVYSLLNSLMVIACRVATPRTPCWLSAMIFSATRRVAGSSTTFRPKVLQTLSSGSSPARTLRQKGRGVLALSARRD
jgi:hypothetical protein